MVEATITLVSHVDDFGFYKGQETILVLEFANFAAMKAWVLSTNEQFLSLPFHIEGAQIDTQSFFCPDLSEIIAVYGY